MSTLQEQLAHLAAHVRDPQRHAGPPGIEARRLKIYSDLVFNNLDGLLKGGFPVIHKTLAPEDWRALVQRFLSRHHAHTPLFPELGRELVAFLQAQPDPARPWLAELAHYEWAEVGLQMSDAALPPHDPDGDLLAGIPVLSPLAWPLAYAWPVHRLSPEFLPDAPPALPALLLLHRERSGKVRFHELAPLTWRLLQRLDEAPTLSGRAQLEALAAEAGAAADAGFLQEGTAMLLRWHREGIVAGVRRDGDDGGAGAVLG